MTLKELIHAQGKTIKDVAKDCDIKLRTFHNRINNPAELKAHEVEKIATSLGVTRAHVMNVKPLKG